MTSRAASWAETLLRAPNSGEQLHRENDRLITDSGTEIGRIENHVFRFATKADDPNINFYRAIGGAHFHERAASPFAMSALDTPVYHKLIERVQPTSKDDVIVDVGGGDGRNALPWLRRGFRRIVVTDAAADALVRFRERVASQSPELLDNLLLIEADSRALPLAEGCAKAVTAIETLYYLNEDYEIGLSQALRVLAPDGLLLIAERDYEGSLITSLLYDGLEQMLRSWRSRQLVDGVGGAVRTRTFTEAELTTILEAHGARVVSIEGTPLVPLILGWMRQQGNELELQESLLPAVADMLVDLSRSGRMRRCHVIVASPSSTN